jgi:hypothetical protein
MNLAQFIWTKAYSMRSKSACRWMVHFEGIISRDFGFRFFHKFSSSGLLLVPLAPFIIFLKFAKIFIIKRNQ